MKIRMIVVSIFLLLFLLTGSYFLYQRFRIFSPNQKENLKYTPPAVSANTSKRIFEMSPNPSISPRQLPYDITFRKPETLTVNGYVEQNLLSTASQSIIVRVPQINSKKDIKVEAKVYPNSYRILTYIPSEGKIQGTQDWRLTSFNELNSFLIPGVQVIIEVQSTEKKAQEYILLAKSNNVLTISPIERMTIGRF